MTARLCAMAVMVAVATATGLSLQDDALHKGSSGRCTTFDNPVLCHPEPDPCQQSLTFTVQLVELWSV